MRSHLPTTHYGLSQYSQLTSMYTTKLIDQHIHIKWHSTIKHFNTVLDHIPNPPIIISRSHTLIKRSDRIQKEYYNIEITTTNDPRFLEMFQATHLLISNNDL